MDEWKDLEIGNIPNEIMTSEDVEIEKVTVCRDMTLKHKIVDIKVKDRWKIFRDISVNRNSYRYRLKPLESMRITRKLHDEIYKILESGNKIIQDAAWSGGLIVKLDEHSIEIIGEE